MRIWIDVEDASGARYGDGPIVTATAWESTRRLDAAGTFAFSMPASDPRSNLLQHKRVVRCWGGDTTGIRELGAGIIEQIEVTPRTASQPAMLRVSGDDLLRELANRTVGDLELFQAVTYSTTASDPAVLRIEESYSNPLLNNGYNLTLPADVDLNTSEPLRFLYVQHSRPFSRITLSLSTLNQAATDTFELQYYNNQDPERPSWEGLGGVVNNTAAAGAGPSLVTPFGVAGTATIEFDPPAGWSPLGGVYIIRMFDQETDLTTFRIEAASVTIVEPVSDGLQRIMALAPAGWSLDSAGAFATQRPVYMQFGGESVLAALCSLAEQTGEHFTLSAWARRVWWIGPGQDDSGLRAQATTAPDAQTMVITGLARTSDTYELCTRIYARGGGLGDGRLTMEKAQPSFWGPSSGYVLAADGSYLEASGPATVYGRIDRRMDFPEITPVDVSEAQVIHAATGLFMRTYHALRRLSQPQYAYRLDVAPGRYDVWPGQTLRVIYHEWVDGFHAVDIDANLVVLEISQRVDAAGVRLASLTVATVDMAPSNDYQAVARLMGSVQTQRAARLPESGLTSRAAGAPVGMTVINGQVTAVRRVRPVDDGWYELSEIGRVRIQGGVVTYMEPA